MDGVHKYSTSVTKVKEEEGHIIVRSQRLVENAFLRENLIALAFPCPANRPPTTTELVQQLILTATMIQITGVGIA